MSQIYVYRAYVCVLRCVHKMSVKRSISVSCPSLLLYFIFTEQNLPFLHHKQAVSKYENHSIPSLDILFQPSSQSFIYLYDHLPKVYRSGNIDFTQEIHHFSRIFLAIVLFKNTHVQLGTLTRIHQGDTSILLRAC